MQSELVRGAFILLACAVPLVFLLGPRARNSRSWAATATPLASIIGSGFLVVAPLLGATVGHWAPVAMVGIVVIAWLIGDVIRHNILHVEPLVEGQSPKSFVTRLDSASGWALAVSYVISVAFYLRLLSAFVLHGIASSDGPLEQWLTTAILLVIGGVGITKGLASLEALERSAVAVKLSIIAALLTGLLLFDVELWCAGTELPSSEPDSAWHAVRVLAGLLLVVQGFETSRYLGAEYEPELRAQTMGFAQLASGAIYLTFVTLMVPLLTDLDPSGGETEIITLSGQVHPILPAMLVIAAAMSQFSAAVADTIGAGGLAQDLSAQRMRARAAYGVIITLAIALTWTADIFEVIALASRGFALYYAMQCTIATTVAWTSGRKARALGFAAVGLVCAFCVVFAVPAG